MRLLGVSILTAATIAGLATVLAFPVAYFLAFRAGASRAVPHAAPHPVRRQLSAAGDGLEADARPEGGINSLLAAARPDRGADPLLLYSRPAVIITLVYIWIPFAALPIYAAMQRIERHHLEAAADLGAGPWARFWRVTVPLSLPGALATFFMVFIPTVGEYVTPDLVGGTDGIMYGNIIQGFFTRSANWPLGSAMAMIMLVLTLSSCDRAAHDQPATSDRMIGIGRTRSRCAASTSPCSPALPSDAVLFVFSFNAGTTLSFPLAGLTRLVRVRHRQRTDARAARNSLVVAAVSATLATMLGEPGGPGSAALPFPRPRDAPRLAGLPLLVPFVVLGVAFFLLFVALDLPRSLADGDGRPHGRRRSYATLILLARLSGLDPALEDAAMDLGATYPPPCATSSCPSWARPCSPRG